MWTNVNARFLAVTLSGVCVLALAAGCAARQPADQGTHQAQARTAAASPHRAGFAATGIARASRCRYDAV